MREKTFRMKYADYKIRVYETDDGRFFAEDNYFSSAQFATWEDAVKRAKECIAATPDEPPTPIVDQEWYTGPNAGRWGLGDLYPDTKENLEKLVESGKPYNTGYFGSKKDESYARIINNGKEVTVEVVRYMDGEDDPSELIYDAMEDEDDFTEEEIAEMADEMQMGTYGSSGGNKAITAKTLQVKASFEEIMDTVKGLDEEADRILKERFCKIKGIVSRKREHKRTNNVR